MITYAEIYSRLITDNTVRDYLEKTKLSDNDKKDFLNYMIATISHYKRNKTYVYDYLPKDFVVLDIETNGFSLDADILQISAIKYKNEKEIDKFDSYLRTKNKITTQITYLTGIDKNKTDQSSSLNEIRNNFISFVGDSPIVGHNIISFDIPRLKNNEIDFSNNELFDTMNIAKSFNLMSDGYSLDAIKKYYGLSGASHNSLADCKNEAEIYLKFLHKDFAIKSDNSVADSFFTGKKVVISGTFSSMSRNTMKALVRKYGGKEMKSVTKNTDIFIDGTQIANNLTDGIHSQKELDAAEFNKSGKLIILKEEEILSKLEALGEKI